MRCCQHRELSASAAMYNYFRTGKPAAPAAAVAIDLAGSLVGIFGFEPSNFQALSGRSISTVHGCILQCRKSSSMSVTAKVNSITTDNVDKTKAYE